MTLHHVSKPHTHRIIRSLSKTHFVKTKHIEMREDIDECFTSPEHLETCSYEVLTHHYRYMLSMYVVCIWCVLNVCGIRGISVVCVA